MSHAVRFERVTARRVGDRLWVACHTGTGRCVLGLTRDHATKIMARSLRRQARQESS